MNIYQIHKHYIEGTNNKDIIVDTFLYKETAEQALAKLISEENRLRELKCKCESCPDHAFDNHFYYKYSCMIVEGTEIECTERNIGELGICTNVHYHDTDYDYVLEYVVVNTDTYIEIKG